MLAPLVPFLIMLIWIVIGAICIYGVLWLLSYFVEIVLPAKIVKGIWLIYVLIVAIWVIRFLAYGGIPFPS